MVAGSLEIQLLANLARLQKDMDRAQKMVGGATSTIEKFASRANQALGMIGAGLSLGAIVAFTRGVLQSIDALNDVKDATGASIENLSALEQIALRNGGTFDTAADAVVKFNKVLGDAKPGSGAEAVLKSLGLSAEQLRRMDPASALHLTSKALSRFADDGNKARLIQELFGKSTKEVAAFLKDVSEQTNLVGKTATAEAEEVERFNKVIFALKTDAMDLARSFTLDLVKAFYAVKKAAEEVNGPLTVLMGTVAGVAAAGGIGLMVTAVKALGGALLGLGAILLANPLVLALLGIGAVAGAGYGALKIYANTTRGIEQAISALEDANRRAEQLLSTPDTSASAGIQRQIRDKGRAEARQEIERRTRQIKELRTELALMQTAAAKADGSYDALEAARLGRNQQAKGSAPGVPDAAAIAAAKREYDALMSTIRQRIDQQRAEAAAGRDLNEHEKFALKVKADMEKMQHPLNAGQRKIVQGLVDEAAALHRAEEARKRYIKAAEAQQKDDEERAQADAEANAQRTQGLLSIYEYGKAIDEAGKRLEVERAAIGKTNEQRQVMLEQLEVRLELERQLEALRKNTGISPEEKAREEDRLRTKAAQAGANAEERIRIEQDRSRSEAIAASIEDGIMNGFRDGKSFADVFLNELKAQFARTILRPMIQPMAEAGNGILGDIFKGAAGGLGGILNDWKLSAGGGFGTGNAYGNQDLGGFLAEGGPARAGVPYIVGERGPELFVPGASGAVVPNERLGGGVTVVNNIYVDSRADQAATEVVVGRAVRDNNKALVEEFGFGR